MLFICTHRFSKFIIVDASATSVAISTTVKPWLGSELREKVVYLGADYANALLDLVAAENLPASFGGTCKCLPDGTCNQQRGAGPWLVGREERRAQWLAGQRTGPGLCWPPEEEGRNSDTTPSA